VLIDCPATLIFLSGAMTFPFLSGEIGELSISVSDSFSSKEMGEFVPEPEWLDPDSIPELESCLLFSKSSSSSFGFE